MHQINFIPPFAFEIKFEKPLWACLDMTLIDIKLHAQNQLYTSFCFWDPKVLIVSLGMPEHAQLKSHHQCVALIDVYIQKKNPLYNSDSFWDIKV